jgi:hypothetical protein
MTLTSRPPGCERVRELLPDYAEPGLRAAGAVELHLASCPVCRGELEEYRVLLRSLAEYRDVEVAVPDGYLEDVLGTARVASYRRLIPGRAQLRSTSIRVGSAVRRHGTGLRYAAATLGGAAAGATAIAIVWWSLARRPMPGAGAL